MLTCCHCQREILRVKRKCLFSHESDIDLLSRDVGEGSARKRGECSVSGHRRARARDRISLNAIAGCQLEYLQKKLMTRTTRRDA